MESTLYFNGFTVSGNHMYGGVNYKINLNPQTDLAIGNACAAQLKYTTDDARAAVIGAKFSCEVDNQLDTLTLGTFTIDEAVIDTQSPDKYHVTAYTNIYLFDVLADQFLENTTFPITLYDFFTNLCTYVGCTNAQGGAAHMTNANFQIVQKPDIKGVYARQLLMWVAQLAAGNAIAVGNNGIVIVSYDSQDFTELTSADYVKATIDANSCQINQVCIYTEDGNKYSVNDGSQAAEKDYYTLSISGNKLVNGSHDIGQAINNIYNNLIHSTYQPGTIELLEIESTYGIGSKIKIGNNVTVVMSEEITDSGIVFSSTGSAKREPFNSYNEASGQPQPAVDFVIGQGKDSSGWSYRKWDSGNYELWRLASLTISGSTKKGNIYVSNQITISIPESLALYSTVGEFVNANLAAGTGGGSIWLADETHPDEKTIKLRFASGSAITPNPGYVAIEVRGRWKA